MAANLGVLLDSGPLVAYLASDEAHHAWATEQFRQHDGPVITCEAVISEAKAEFDGPVHAVVAGETIELQRS